MIVHLLAFATVADLLGHSRVKVELPEGSRIEDLAAKLQDQQPQLRALWSRLAIAVDGELVGPDEELKDGVEVALLPPVSGGCGKSSVAGRVWLAKEALNAERVVEAVADPGRGAVLVFEGRVRDHHRGENVKSLFYEAYEPMARLRLERIVAELEAADESVRVAIAHRQGLVAAGETSVVIAVASAHRGAAYEASRQALERLKTEVPIWKRENFGDGRTAWREEEALA
ncbi:MAG: molybdenum cofactor biosynthesis protein MoaE [Acidobacteriota bacterium]